MSEPSKVLYIDMTPERKAQWGRVTSEIIDLLKREFPSPIEAHAVLKIVLESMQQTYDIQDSFLMKERIQ
jgi:hypothetical protein